MPSVPLLAWQVAAFHQLLKLNRTVLVSDVDTVWTANPQDYLASLPAAVDIGVTSDCLSREADENKRGDSKRFDSHGVWFCGHNPGNTFGATFNTGVLYLRPTLWDPTSRAQSCSGSCCTSESRELRSRSQG